MFKGSLIAGIAAFTALLLVLVFFFQGAAESGSAATAIVLPQGDAEAGRQVMSSLGCALCHRAAGDHGMPEPASAQPGPELGPAQANQSTEFLVESILRPSHQLPEGFAEGTVSPMLDYQDISVRQLSDVIAYIRYLGE